MVTTINVYTLDPGERERSTHKHMSRVSQEGILERLFLNLSSWNRFSKIQSCQQKVAQNTLNIEWHRIPVALGLGFSGKPGNLIKSEIILHQFMFSFLFPFPFPSHSHSNLIPSWLKLWWPVPVLQKLDNHMFKTKCSIYNLVSVFIELLLQCGPDMLSVVW